MIALLAGAAYYLFRRKTPLEKPAKNEPRTTTPKNNEFYPSKSQRQILEALKENEGVATQKKLRKELNHLSEARVSMDLTELEEHGFVKRFKRGRGNKVKLL